MTRIGLTLLIAGVALVGCGGDTDSGSSPDDTDSLQLAPDGTRTGDTAAADTANVLPEATHVATITTDQGDIVLELYGNDAPKTVENFIGHAKAGYYDGIAFHRVVPEFVIQAGDPLSKDTTQRTRWGTGGKPFRGSTLEDEIDTSNRAMKLGYRTGVVAMANTGRPNSGSSQFFIVLGDAVDNELQDIYTIFGKVRSGMETVTKIEMATMPGQEIPQNPSRITKVIIADVPVVGG
jgi:cyclophilin family peptidyl-prolyl cis-trans isomerase